VVLGDQDEVEFFPLGLQALRITCGQFQYCLLLTNGKVTCMGGAVEFLGVGVSDAIPYSPYSPIIQLQSQQLLLASLTFCPSRMRYRDNLVIQSDHMHMLPSVFHSLQPSLRVLQGRHCGKNPWSD
jgi:hypothetical protein